MAAKSSSARPKKVSAELQQALKTDLSLARKMLCVLNAQAEALTVNDARSVGMMERHSRALVKQQQENDRVREAAIASLVTAAGLSAPGRAMPLLSEIAPKLPLSEARAILALRREILATHEHIRCANDRNRALLESALTCVESTLDTIREFAFRPGTYGTNQNTLLPATIWLNQTA
jgi:flagellar biosynthesis/type III secretory pathway chaperone